MCVYRFDRQVEGGDSVFLDSFYVAEELRKQFPDDFENLVRIPATFQKVHFERYEVLGLFPCSKKNYYYYILIKKTETGKCEMHFY